MEVDPATRSRLRWIAFRIREHWRWGRTQGFGRLIEEDQLNPVARIALGAGKWRWRRVHEVAPNAIPVYVVGVQRSGTNMVVRGLETSPEFEVHNENSGRAFRRFRLLPDPEIRALVERSGHRYVLFKPLADSHRTAELLDGLGTPSPGRAIWVYRSVDGRVRSALTKFGSNNLVVLREIAAGRGNGLWQRQGLSAELLALVRSFDYERLSPESAAALFWYLRNTLLFELGLDRREDVLPVHYDALVRGPETVMRTVCAFLAFPYDPKLTAHVTSRQARNAAPLAIDPVIRERCTALQSRLDAAAEARRAALFGA
jgi:hypothetical protein